MDETMMKAKAEEQQPMGVGSILATYVVMMNGHVFRNQKVLDAEKLSAVEIAYVVMQRTHFLVMEEMTACGIKPASKVVEAELEKTAEMFAAKMLEAWAPRDTGGDAVQDNELSPHWDVKVVDPDVGRFFDAAVRDNEAKG